MSTPFSCRDSKRAAAAPAWSTGPEIRTYILLISALTARTTPSSSRFCTSIFPLPELLPANGVVGPCRELGDPVLQLRLGGADDEATEHVVIVVGGLAVLLAYHPGETIREQPRKRHHGGQRLACALAHGNAN